MNVAIEKKLIDYAIESLLNDAVCNFNTRLKILDHFDAAPDYDKWLDMVVCRAFIPNDFSFNEFKEILNDYLIPIYQADMAELGFDIEGIMGDGKD